MSIYPMRKNNNCFKINTVGVFFMYDINIAKKLKCFCLIHVNKPGKCSLGHGRSD